MTGMEAATALFAIGVLMLPAGGITSIEHKEIGRWILIAGACLTLPLILRLLIVSAVWA